jgi:hypothetical protein
LHKVGRFLEFIEGGILAASGLVWAIAGFPNFTEVAVFGCLFLGVLVWIIWDKK